MVVLATVVTIETTVCMASTAAHQRLVAALTAHCQVLTGFSRPAAMNHQADTIGLEKLV